MWQAGDEESLLKVNHDDLVSELDSEHISCNRMYHVI